MLDVIPIWKTHDAPHGNNGNGRNKLTVFLHNFRLSGGERLLLRAFRPDHRALYGTSRLILHENLNVCADRADRQGAQKQETKQARPLALGLRPGISDART